MKSPRVVGMFVTFTIALFAMLSLTGMQAYADDVPPWVTIESISTSGTGCPAGSVHPPEGGDIISPDKKAFTLGFDEYYVEIGPYTALKDKRKNCLISARLKFPQGWSYTVGEVNYHVWADLEKNVEATQSSTYSFEGQYGSQTLKTVKKGEFLGEYHFQDTLSIKEYVWSPCGKERALNINTSLYLNNSKNKKGKGFIQNDFIDGEFQTVSTYYLTWKKCDY